VVDQLRRLRAAQAKAALKRKPTEHYVDRGLVFAGRFGDPVETRNLANRHLKPILKAAKLPDSVRLYDLRHTCATLLAADGENPKVIAERLGHASTDMTLNRYTHVSPGMQHGATKKIGEILIPGGLIQRRVS
jgi:integrase